MKDLDSLDRREFTLAAALSALAGATILVTEGCGGGSSPSSSNGSNVPTPVPGQISDNHGHEAEITVAQLQAGGELRLDIQGAADHPHTVVLSAGEVVSIRQGGQVVKETTTTVEHMHRVTFRGPANDPGGIY